MSTRPRMQRTRVAMADSGLLWLGYAALAAALIALYIILLAWHGSIGVDFARGATLRLVSTAHGRTEGQTAT